jgi:hypothetical protein
MGRRIAISFALLVTTFAGLLSPGLAAAQSDGGGLQGNSYTDPVYGFTVEWDVDTFDAEEMLGDDGAPFGVYLTSEEITASVAAGGYGDLEECLDDRVARLEAIDGVTGLRESRRVDPLEFDRDIFGGVYQYTYENPDTGDSGTYATYFGCEPLLIDGEEQPDVVLTHDFGTALDVYDDLSGEWITVINGITYAGGSASDEDQTNTTDRDDTDGAGTGGISGNTYIDPTYFYSVAWDEDLYEAEEISDDDAVPYGVTLSNDAVLWTIFSGMYPTRRACVNGEADAIEAINGVTDFEEADDLELPQSDPDARIALYRYTSESAQSGDSIDLVQYIECRDIVAGGEVLEDVFLVIEFGMPEALYADNISAAEEIIGSIEFDVDLATDDGGRDDNGSNATDEPGVSGNRYLDPTDGWAVTWDDTALTGENWMSPDDSEIAGVQLSSETNNFLTIVGEDHRSLRSCVSSQVEALEGSPFTGFEEVDDVELPETGDDARAAIYQGIFTSDSDLEIDIYLYVECRPMISDGEEVEGRFLVVNMFSMIETYADDLPAVSEVLTSVEFDAAGASRDEPDPDRTPDGDTAESGIEGDTYTSSIGYQLTWDDSVYDASLFDEENPDQGVNLSSDGSFMTFQVVGDPSAQSCVEAEAGIVEGLSGMSSLSTSREDSPQAADDSASQLYEGILTFDDGSETEVVVYIECRPLGAITDSNLFVVIRMVGLADAYPDELPSWQEILDSIRYFEPAG